MEACLASCLRIIIRQSHHKQKALACARAGIFSDGGARLSYTCSMYYMFYEAKEPQTKKSKTPIVLWLQGGPGCSSLFGMVREAKACCAA